MSRRLALPVGLAVLGILAEPGLPCARLALAEGQAVGPPQAARISASWRETPVRDVLLAFATFSGKSIVSGAGVSGSVTAEIVDRPWDAALQAILAGQGLVAVEDVTGIIRVQDMETLDAREAIEPIVTRVYRLSFARAEEIRSALEPLLSDRGRLSVSPSTNSVVVSDVARVHAVIGGSLRE